MRKFIFTFLLLLLFTPAAFSEIVEKNGKFGVVENDVIVVPFEYIMCNGDDGEYVAQKADGTFDLYFLNKPVTILYNIDFLHEIDNYSGVTYFHIEKNGISTVIFHGYDSGVYALPRTYEYIGCTGTRYFFIKQNRKIGIIDIKSGQTVLDPYFDNRIPITNELYALQKDDKYYIYNAEKNMFAKKVYEGVQRTTTTKKVNLKEKGIWDTVNTSDFNNNLYLTTMDKLSDPFLAKQGKENKKLIKSAYKKFDFNKFAKSAPTK